MIICKHHKNCNRGENDMAQIFMKLCLLCLCVGCVDCVGTPPCYSTVSLTTSYVLPRKALPLEMGFALLIYFKTDEYVSHLIPVKEMQRINKICILGTHMWHQMSKMNIVLKISEYNKLSHEHSNKMSVKNIWQLNKESTITKHVHYFHLTAYRVFLEQETILWLSFCIP